MINQITLACFTQGHSEQFINKETWAVCELYCSFLKSFDSLGVKKCVINVRSDWGELNNFYKNFTDVISIYKHFDFEIYYKRNNYDKKKMQLEAIHNGMMEIALKESWETDTLLDAYNACLDKKLKYQFFAGKQSYSPNRKNYIRYWCNWDLDVFEVFWVLYDKTGNELVRKLFIEKPPFLGEFIYFIKSKWVDNEKVEVWDTYKYGDNTKYVITIE